MCLSKGAPPLDVGEGRDLGGQLRACKGPPRHSSLFPQGPVASPPIGACVLASPSLLAVQLQNPVQDPPCFSNLDLARIIAVSSSPGDSTMGDGMVTITASSSILHAITFATTCSSSAIAAACSATATCAAAMEKRLQRQVLCATPLVTILLASPVRISTFAHGGATRVGRWRTQQFNEVDEAGGRARHRPCLNTVNSGIISSMGLSTRRALVLALQLAIALALARVVVPALCRGVVGVATTTHTSAGTVVALTSPLFGPLTPLPPLPPLLRGQADLGPFVSCGASIPVLLRGRCELLRVL